MALGLHQIGKLRHDANQRWLYQGKQQPRDRPRRYEGKVNFEDFSRFEFAGQIDNLEFYTTWVNSAGA